MPNRTNDAECQLHAGQMLGRYELLMPIAKGGMGNVWAARLKGTRGFRKLVAIKTILQDLENDQLEQMFYREAVLASQIQHPNVAETLELGEHEGTLYLVMELVSGESLRYLLREAHSEGGVPLLVSVNLIGQVCHGLAAAHDLRDEHGNRVGLVHRDISPPNVLITDNGTVKIVDFGVATTASSRTFGSGEIKGKISYLAPEQLRSEALDARVDVFTTGILLYLLTVGKHPFRAASEASTIARILSSAPAPAPSMVVDDYPAALEAVVMRALDKDRETRTPSATVFLEELEKACPEAFGPRAEERVARYVQELMKDRLLERRATLRMAEDWAETSSARHSTCSLPVVTASAPPLAASRRGAWLGLGGILTGLGVAAAALTLYAQLANAVPEPNSHSGVAAALPSAAALVTLGGRAVEANRIALDPIVVQDRAPVASASAVSALVPREHPRATRANRDQLELSRPQLTPEHSAQSESTAAEAEAPSTSVEVMPEPALTPPASEAVHAALPGAVAAPAEALANGTSLPRAPTGPRLLASRAGQARLLTNPDSEASRVHLPDALARTGQTFSATVNVCVSERGQVSKVSILRSAGPALDPQIPATLSHWKYRPLLEAGDPTPFCYVLNYEVRAR